MDASALQEIVACESCSELDLLIRAADGDRTAFNVLHSRYHKAIFDFALRSTGSFSTAEDITQDAYVTLLIQAKRFQPERGSLQNWLFGITRNLALKRLRKLSKENSLESLVEGSTIVDSTPLQEVLTGEIGTAVKAAVGSLPPLEREVLILFQYEGLLLTEIASVVGADLSAVKSRLHRARERLRSLLAPLHSKRQQG